MLVLGGGIALAAALLIGVQWASALQVDLHGIGFNKGCESPTNVGSAYACTYAVLNTTDTTTDTLTFDQLSDVVHAIPSDVASGNILASLEVASLTGGAFCDVSGTNTGPGATGNTLCTLPDGATITFAPFSFYTTDANDPTPLTDTATLRWQDLCNSGSPNCPVGNQNATTGSQSVLQTLTPTPTDTPTPTPTDTPTPTPTDTPTPTPTDTPTPTPTDTPTPTPTDTPTPTPTNTPTNTPTPVGEGCTPGYWKQPQHFDSWTAPYDPTDLFSDHFEDAFPGLTLLEVLQQGGGGLNALGRHTVAALLNAASPDVSSVFTTADVINMFNAVFPGGDYEALKNIFAAQNEIGCPLN
jgi:hypothetical protein